MDADETALWWARIRAAGPQLTDTGGALPPGLMRLPEPGGSQAWLMTVLPGGAGPSVLDELDLPRPVLEQPNDTARVLAAALKCCWPDPSGPLWPGVDAPFRQVAATFEGITGRDEVVSHRALVAALRRLSWSGWLLWDESPRTVRLGPRVATWPPAELSTLRELWRSIPVPVPTPVPVPVPQPGRCDIAVDNTTAMSHRPSSEEEAAAEEAAAGEAAAGEEEGDDG